MFSRRPAASHNRGRVPSGPGEPPPPPGPTPELTSAAIDSTGLLLVLTYNQALDAGSVPALGDFALAGTVLSTLTGTPGVSGSTVELDLAPAVDSAETGITISYTPSASPIQSAAGDDAAALTNEPVTNGSTHDYDPRDEGGAVLWTDMSDATSYTESAGVITARSNKISAAALTPVASPGYQAAGLNSLPTADYTGANYFLTSEAAVVACGVDQNPCTYISVTALDIPDRAEVFFGWANSGVASNSSKYFGQTITASGLTVATFSNDAATTVTVTGTIASNTTAHVYAFRHTGTVVDSKIDNVADIAAIAFAPATNTPNRAAISSRPDSVPDRFFDGQSSEEWLFNKALSDAALTRVHTYLKAKWGTP